MTSWVADDPANTWWAALMRRAYGDRKSPGVPHDRSGSNRDLAQSATISHRRRLHLDCGRVCKWWVRVMATRRRIPRIRPGRPHRGGEAPILTKLKKIHFVRPVRLRTTREHYVQAACGRVAGLDRLGGLYHHLPSGVRRLFRR